jgi:hypothetical protein
MGFYSSVWRPSSISEEPSPNEASTKKNCFCEAKPNLPTILASEVSEQSKSPKKTALFAQSPVSCWTRSEKETAPWLSIFSEKTFLFTEKFEF